MRLTTAGMVRLSVVLFVVAAGLFAAGFAVADRATAGSGDEAPVVGTDGAPTTAPTAAPDGTSDRSVDPGGSADQGGSAGSGRVPAATPTVVETRLVTVTAPPVTVAVTPATPTGEGATTAPTPTDEDTGATTTPTTSQPAPTGRPSTTPTGPPVTGAGEDDPEPTPTS